MKLKLIALLMMLSPVSRADVFEAAGRADLATLKKEIKTAAQANARNDAGETPLIRASGTGDEATIRFLLGKGADVNAKDKSGRTALFYAVSENVENIAQLLIDRKADLTLLYGDKKENILFEASRVGALGVLKTVTRKNKALVNQLNTDGETALFEARRSAQSAAADILIKVGAKKDIVNKAGKKADEL